MNHLGYADECSDCCDQYALGLDLVYNGSKSVCILFHPKDINVMLLTFIYLTVICMYANSHKYLGIILEDGNCDKDVTRQLKRFHPKSNLLLRKFGKCTLNTKLELFTSYCTNMHCGIFWHDATKKSLTKLRVSYNISCRRLFGLPYYCNASEMFLSCDILTQPEITRKMTWGFIEKLRRCNNNVLIKDVMDSALVLSSRLWQHFYKTLLGSN